MCRFPSERFQSVSETFLKDISADRQQDENRLQHFPKLNFKRNMSYLFPSFQYVKYCRNTYFQVSINCFKGVWSGIGIPNDWKGNFYSQFSIPQIAEHWAAWKWKINVIITPFTILNVILLSLFLLNNFWYCCNVGTTSLDEQFWKYITFGRPEQCQI